MSKRALFSGPVPIFGGGNALVEDLEAYRFARSLVRDFQGSSVAGARSTPEAGVRSWIDQNVKI